MKFTVRDRHSLLIGKTRVVNDSGRTIRLVIPEAPVEHCRERLNM